MSRSETNGSGILLQSMMLSFQSCRVKLLSHFFLIYLESRNCKACANEITWAETMLLAANASPQPPEGAMRKMTACLTVVALAGALPARA